MLFNPGGVEHLAVEAIAHQQLAAIAAHHAGELEVGMHQVLLFVGHGLLALPDAAVGAQQLGAIALGRPFAEHVAHELQVVVLLAPLAAEGARHRLIHRRFAPLGRWVGRQHTAEALAQIGVAARPAEDPAQGTLGLIRRQGQTRRQGGGLGGREIAQVDTLADVERSAFRIADQIGGGGHADQHERQAPQGRILGTGNIEVADRREEVVGELQAQGGVDLINKDHDRFAHLRQHHLLKEARQSQGQARLRLLLPPGAGMAGQLQLLGHHLQHIAIPGFGIDVGADLGEIHRHRPESLRQQLFSGAEHQARFAQLARGEHIGKPRLPA